MNYPNISSLFVSLDSSIRQVIECIDHSGRVSIALIVDENHHLINTITDGDVRRGILAGFSISDPLSNLLLIKSQMLRPTAITASMKTDPSLFLQIMQENAVKQLPLIDSEGKVVDIVILSDLLPSSRLPLQAVVMAGGTRDPLAPIN